MIEHFFVVGIDPGVTTGIVVADVSTLDATNNALLVTEQKLYADEINEYTIAAYVQNYVNFHMGYRWHKHTKVLLTIEKWHGGTGGELQSITNRIIGSFIFMGKSMGWEVKLQRNVERLPHLDTVRSLDLKKKSVHSKDAFAHVLNRIAHSLPQFRDKPWRVFP